MTNDRWKIGHLLAQAGEGTQPLSPSLFECIADELEAALSSPSGNSLRELSQQLSEVTAKQFSALPSVLRTQLTNDEFDSEAQHLFSLGQLEFAQLIATQASERRVDDEFIGTLKDRRFEPYVTSLSDVDMTNTELAANLGVEDETVSRNLRKLRALGVTDFRREGKNVVNFLTPATRGILAQTKNQIQTAKSESFSQSRPALLAGIKSEIPDFLQEPLNLSPHNNSSALAA